MQTKAHPRGGIRSIDTISPYWPNVSDSSSCCTSFDRWPTHSVVLHTAIQQTVSMSNKVVSNWVPMLSALSNCHFLSSKGDHQTRVKMAGFMRHETR